MKKNILFGIIKAGISQRKPHSWTLDDDDNHKHVRFLNEKSAKIICILIFCTFASMFHDKN